MHIFGLLGTLLFMLGFALAFYLGVEKLYYLSIKVKAPLVANNPWFYIALTSMMLGTQLFLAGFLGELVARNNPDRNSYLIGDKLNL